MEVVHDLCQILLGLVLAGYIVKLDALGGFHIYLGVGFAHIEHHGVAAAHFFRHLLGHELSQRKEDEDGRRPAENIHQQGGLLDLFAGGGYPGIQQPLHQTVVRHHGGLVNGLFILAGEENTVILLLNLHLADLTLLRHGDEGVVIHLLDLILGQPGHGDEVEQHHQQHCHNVIENQRLLWGSDFVHTGHSFK